MLTGRVRLKTSMTSRQELSTNSTATQLGENAGQCAVIRFTTAARDDVMEVSPPLYCKSARLHHALCNRTREIAHKHNRVEKTCSWLDFVNEAAENQHAMRIAQLESEPCMECRTAPSMKLDLLPNGLTIP